MKPFIVRIIVLCMIDTQRAKFGIQSLDKWLGGSITENNIVLVSGGAGTGKSTFCMQFLINGAELFGEKGLYISTEQSEKELFKAASSYGWKFQDLIKSGMVKVVYFNVIRGDSFLESIKKELQDFLPKRVVIDSLTSLTDGMLISDLNSDTSFSMIKVSESINPVPRTEKLLSKTILYNLFATLKSFSTTALLTSELPDDSKFLSGDEVSEFVADGVIILRSASMGDTVNRTLQIKKMRYTSMDGGVQSYLITQTGISFE